MAQSTTPAVIALTPNPALDITLDIPNFASHATIRIPPAHQRLGGKGINVASVCAEQGYEAFSLGPVPAAYQQPTQQPAVTEADPGKVSKQQHLHPYYSDTPAGLRSTYALHDKSIDSTTIFNEPGFAHPEAVYGDIGRRLEELLAENPQAIVTLSGSFAPQTPPNFLTDMINCSHTYGAKIIVDTSGPYLLQACAAGADLVKPNKEELLEATQAPDVPTAAQQLLTAGAQAVLVSLGAEGLQLYVADQTFGARLEKPCTGNPTGAGDALVAAVATAYLDDLAYPDLLQRAVSWSAAAVLSPIAGSIGQKWQPLQAAVQLS